MKMTILLGVSVLLLASTEVRARDGWIYDGVRKCVFDENQGGQPTRCAQYYQAIEHKLKGRVVGTEFRWMWKKGDAFEVRYTARIGVIGVSNFTIGEIFDKRKKFLPYPQTRAVSYSPSRVELIIGVPNEGYEFSVKGGT